MKTYSFRSFGMALALSAVPFVAGCSAESSSASADPTSTVSAASVQPALATPDKEVLPPSTPPAEKPLPASISNPSPSLAEVIKLTHAGVDESVVLAFIDGSQSAFNLGSDEIIYLSDLGVADEVMTAMMERDAVLKQPWAPPGQVATAAAETPRYVEPEVAEEPIAAAPTYVDPPQPVYDQEPVVVNNNYFYETLAPYGSWVNVSGYGYCWQPTVAVINSSWQPYCDRGRWAYTSAGWYWQSDYSWGATFHYGRWFNQPGRGWCWAPDTVWAPSWVTWRYNNNYCGWAPLPPASYCQTGIGLSYVSGSVGTSFSFGLSSDCYTFVSWGNLCSPQPYRHCAPRSQNAVIARNSTVINNYVTGDGNTIINHGIAPEQVEQYSGRPLSRTSMADARSRRGTGWQARNNAAAPQLADSRNSRESATGPDRSRNNRVAGINTLADAGGNNSYRPSASSMRERAQTSDNNNNNRPASSTRPAATPLPQRDRLDDRDSSGPRPGIPERRSRPASMIVNGSSATAGRGQAATAQSAPPGSLILNGERDGNNSSRDNSRYVPPSLDRSFAGRDVRPSTAIRRESPQTQARSSTPRPSLPQTATAWTPPGTQNVRSTDNNSSYSRAERRVQSVSSQSVVASRQIAAATPTLTPAPQQIRSAPTRANVPQQVSAPAQAARPSPSASPRMESRSAPSQRSEAASRQSSPASSTRQSSGNSGWGNSRR